MARPTIGANKRQRLNSTFDPAVIERARVMAKREKKSLPLFLEELIAKEDARSAAAYASAARVVDSLPASADRTRAARKWKGK